MSLCYCGVFSRSRLFPNIIDLVGNMDGVVFHIAGKPEGLYRLVENKCRQYSNIYFYGSINPSDVLGLICNSDLVYCVFDPCNVNSCWGLPNRFFECIMLGKPLLVTKGTYVGGLVEKYGCGLVCDYSIDSICSVLSNVDLDFLKEYGFKGRFLFESGWSWDVEEQHFLEVYDEVVF